MAEGGEVDFSSLELSIDIDGNWRHQNVIITHPRILALLFRSLKKAGAAYIICAENLCLPVTVADCPYAVLSVRHEPAGIDLLLSDGTHEWLNPQALTLDRENIPRTVVKNGEFPARFTRAAWLQLAEAITEDGQGGYTLILAGRAVPLHPLISNDNGLST